MLHESQTLIREPAATGALHEVLLIRYAAASHRALLSRVGITRDDRHGGTSSPIPASESSDPLGARDIALPQRKWRHPQAQAPSESAEGAQRSTESALDARLARVRRIGTAFVPSARVWAEVFAQEAGGAAAGSRLALRSNHSYAGPRPDDDARVLRAVYEFWRQKDGVEATIAWATWLLRSGDGREAVAVVARARSVLGDGPGAEVERRWKAVLDGDGDGIDVDEDGARESEGDATEGAAPV